MRATKLLCNNCKMDIGFTEAHYFDNGTMAFIGVCKVCKIVNILPLEKVLEELSPQGGVS